MKPRNLDFSYTSVISMEPNFTNSEVNVSDSSISPSRNQTPHNKHHENCIFCEVKGSVRNIRKAVLRELSYKYSDSWFLNRDNYLDQILRENRSRALILFKEINFDTPQKLLRRFYFNGELKKIFVRVYKRLKFMLLTPQAREPSYFLRSYKVTKRRIRDEVIRRLISNIPESVLDQLDPEKISEYENSKTYLFERPDSSIVTPLLKELKPDIEQLISPTPNQNFENMFFNLYSKSFSEGEGFNEKSLCPNQGLNQISSNLSFLHFCKLRRRESESASRLHSISFGTSINIKNRNEEEPRRADIQDNQTFPKVGSFQYSNPEKMMCGDQAVYELITDNFPHQDDVNSKHNNQPVSFSDVSKIQPEFQSNVIKEPLLNLLNQNKLENDKEQSNSRPIIQKAVQSLTFNTQFNSSSNSKNFEYVELQIPNTQATTYKIDVPFNGILYNIQSLQKSSNVKLAGRKESDGLPIDIVRKKLSSNEKEFSDLKLVQRSSSKQKKHEQNIIKVDNSNSVKEDVKSPVITSNRNSTRLNLNKIKSCSKSNSKKIRLSAEVKSKIMTMTASIKQSKLTNLLSAQTQEKRSSLRVLNLVNNTSKIHSIKLTKKVGIREVNSNCNYFRKDVKIIPQSFGQTNLNTLTTSKKPEEPFAPKLIGSNRNQTQHLFIKGFPQNKPKEERATSSNLHKKTKSNKNFPSIISRRPSIKISNYETYSSKNSLRKSIIIKKSNLPEITSPLLMPNFSNFQSQNPKNSDKVSENLESQSLKHYSKNSIAKSKFDKNFGVMSHQSNEQYKVYLHARKSFDVDGFKPISVENPDKSAKKHKRFSRTNHFLKKIVEFESKESKSNSLARSSKLPISKKEL